MIYNDDTYYIGYHKNVRALKAVPALVFDTIVGLLRDPNNKTGEVANKTLQDILGVSKPTIVDAINKIIEVGYIVRTNGDGRGNKSVYVITEKGKKNIPFMNKKGSRNFTERVKEIDYKGKEILPINEELNKELKEKEETPTPVVMEKEFLEFWDKMLFSPDWDYDKENCARVWDGMPSEWRTKLVAMAQNGLRWRTKENDKPIFYLRDYRGQDVNMELPFVRNGSAQIDHWQRDGKTICVMMYEGRVAYCLAESRATMESAGAQYLRDF